MEIRPCAQDSGHSTPASRKDTGRASSSPSCESSTPPIRRQPRSSSSSTIPRAHPSKETTAWLAGQPEGRFTFVFTPKPGSWLNLVEGFFSKMARSVLRHIRVASKQQLNDRILTAIDDLNRDPAVHTWTYKLSEPA
jgi:transposase